MLHANDTERERLLAERRSLLSPALVDRAAARITNDQIRDHVEGIRAEQARYAGLGFVDQAVTRR
jgi:hypothetical protein